MVPSSSRQLLVWSLPTLAFLLSFLWYRRKRGVSAQSDPGGTTHDTDSTPEDTNQQAEDRQVSTAGSLLAEKQFVDTEKLCKNVTSAHGEIKVQTDRSESPFCIAEEETKPDCSPEQRPELAIEKVSSETGSAVYTVAASEADNCEDSDVNECDTEKEMNATECPLSNSDQELFSQTVPVNSAVKEDPKIVTLEGSFCNILDNPEHLTDQINDTVSLPEQVEGKEVHETADNELGGSVGINISHHESSESCSLLPEVCVLAISDSVERTAQKQNSIGGGLDALPLDKVNVEDIYIKLQESDIRTQQDNGGTGEEFQGSKSEVQVMPLNIIVTENLKFVESVEKDIDSIPLISDTKISLSAEDKEETLDSDSVSSVDSFSVATTVITRKSSTETLTMEKHVPEDEDAKKSAAEYATEGSTPVLLECKLSSLELNENVTGETSSDTESVSGNGGKAETFAAVSEQQRTERDSANHSPADGMLASPSISNCSDAQSEGSSDSGKGCSDVATPPLRTPASGSSLSGDASLPSVYEFVLPQYLVGRLIGRHGCFVHEIKKNTNASIFIKRHPDTKKLKICAVEGSQADIESALEMIREKFPENRYPDVTLEQVCFLPPVPTFPLIPESLQLPLVEGVTNDVIVSSLISPAHFFLQQPTHPSFLALSQLNACMNICYSEPMAPPLPTPIQVGSICVAPAMGGWYRAQVVAVGEETEACEMKFVDYGGYSTVNSSVLRQIRGDFMTLPFQAVECYLANVMPFGGHEAVWSKESVAGMEELTQGQVLQAQVCGYAEDGLPVVYLYAMHGSKVVLVNQELVSRGLAEWMESADA